MTARPSWRPPCPIAATAARRIAAQIRALDAAYAAATDDGDDNRGLRLRRDAEVERLIATVEAM